MDLTPEEKSMLFQHVHCTKYLKKKPCKYWLERNDNDGAWYYRDRNAPDAEPEKAVKNELFWKHNLRFEIKEKKFSGIVVKVSDVDFCTSLGIPDNPNFGNPCRELSSSILAATVYFRNGMKRLVPLDCIQEFFDFCNGKNTSIFKVTNRHIGNFNLFCQIGCMLNPSQHYFKGVFYRRP